MTGMADDGLMSSFESDGSPAVRQIVDIDVAGLAEALDDGGDITNWWYDPSNGQIEMTLADDDVMMDLDEGDDPYERGLVAIEAVGSRPAYIDMVEFTASIADPQAADLLSRALEGRGAFGRFRDTMYEFSELKEPWLAYRSAAAERRAIVWLLDHGYITPDDAATAQSIRLTAIEGVLLTIGAPHGETIDESEISARCADVCAMIDDGRVVNITRGGRPWATLSPAQT